MNKKTILIGLGVLAVAGIGYYMWKKKSETTSGACGCSGADGEDYSNFKAKPTGSAGEGKQWCCAEYNTYGDCNQWESRSIGSKCGGATYGVGTGGKKSIASVTL
jgi:hypothetical protein